MTVKNRTALVVTLGAMLAGLVTPDIAFCLEKNPSPPSRLTNPLLGYARFKELRPFKSLIAAKIDQAVKSGDVEAASVYFRSLSDGMWFGISEREEFSPASILKIPVMFTYYRLARKDPALLSKKFRYGFISDNEAADTINTHTAVPGEYYTADQLIYFMTAESDNSAASLLTADLPIQDFVRTFKDFGIDISQDRVRNNFTSLKISATMLRVLYNASYLDEEYSEKALRILSSSTFRSGIRAGVPAGYIVANKFGIRTVKGSGQRQLHDVGIVYHPENPYILAVMTKGFGKDYSRLAKLIQEISAVTFREVSSQQKAKAEPEEVNIE